MGGAIALFLEVEEALRFFFGVFGCSIVVVVQGIRRLLMVAC
jgi:hypothetical protein